MCAVFYVRPELRGPSLCIYLLCIYSCMFAVLLIIRSFSMGKLSDCPAYQSAFIRVRADEVGNDQEGQGVEDDAQEQGPPSRRKCQGVPSPDRRRTEDDEGEGLPGDTYPVGFHIESNPSRVIPVEDQAAADEHGDAGGDRCPYAAETGRQDDGQENVQDGGDDVHFGSESVFVQYLENCQSDVLGEIDGEGHELDHRDPICILVAGASP